MVPEKRRPQTKAEAPNALGWYHHAHFRDDKTEAQSGKGTCPRSHS